MNYYIATIAETDQNTIFPKETDTINEGLLKKDSTKEHPVIIIDVSLIDEHIDKIR